MIKIIKEGTKKITVCLQCGCEFSYEEEDILTSATSIGGYKRYVPCPQCHKEQTVFSTK